MLLPALNKAREKARSISCLNNLKQVSQAFVFYSMDSREYIPFLVPNWEPWGAVLNNSEASSAKDSLSDCSNGNRNRQYLSAQLLRCPSTSNSSAWRTYGMFRCKDDGNTAFLNSQLKNFGVGEFMVRIADDSVYYNFKKMKQTSELFLVADTRSGFDRTAGLWQWRPKKNELNQGISLHHGGRANLAFADGHAGSVTGGWLEESIFKVTQYCQAGGAWTNL